MSGFAGGASSSRATRCPSCTAAAIVDGQWQSPIALTDTMVESARRFESAFSSSNNSSLGKRDIDSCNQQAGGEIIDAVIAKVFQDMQGNGLPGTGKPADNYQAQFA